MTFPDSLAVGDLWESEAKVVINHPSIPSILSIPSPSPYAPEIVTGTPGQAEALDEANQHRRHITGHPGIQ